MSITEFIEARLDETERIAREASERSERWTRQGTWWLEGVEHEVVGDEEVLCHPHNAAHIALNDPTHVLAWVAALRAVIALHEAFPYFMEPGGLWCSTCGGKGGFYPCATVRAIAAVWHERPDFESEWA